MKTCNKCNHESLEGDKFCHECGSKLGTPLYLWFLMIIIIIALIIMIFVFVSSFQDNIPKVDNSATNGLVSDQCKNCNEFEYKCTLNDKSICENVGSKEKPCYKWIEYKNYDKCNKGENYCASYDIWYNCENIGGGCYDWVAYNTDFYANGCYGQIYNEFVYE